MMALISPCIVGFCTLESKSAALAIQGGLPELIRGSCFGVLASRIVAFEKVQKSACISDRCLAAPWP